MHQDSYQKDCDDHTEDEGAELFEEYQEETRGHGYWRRLGGGSLTVSIMAHAVFALIAVFLILWRGSPQAVPPPEQIVPGGGGGSRGQQIALHKQHAVTHAQPARKLAVLESNILLPGASNELSHLQALTRIQPGGGFGNGGTGGTGPGDGPGLGLKRGLGLGPGDFPGFVNLPKMLRSRCMPAERLRKLKENGGNDACEAAVKKTLRWLKQKQNADGSWGETSRGGITGLALLAYLGHCETPESPAYGDTVIRGIMFLMELAAKNKAPFDGIYSEAPGTTKSTYEHGIASYAMGETYSFAKLGTRPIPDLRESFEKGVLIIINRQKSNGAWNYKDGIGYDQYGDRNDLSVTGWQYQALKAARHTGLEIPGLQGAVRKVESYLESVQTADGGFGGRSRADHYNQWNLTGAALLGLQTLGVGNTGRINKGIRFLVDDIKKEPRTWNADCYLYTWYYDTQALFQKGGEPWQAWNDQFQKEILTNQNGDGSYRVESVGAIVAAGSGAAAGDRDIYRACLCTLMLEVYYRYLKVGDRGAEGGTSNLMPIR